jgi:hypothetical protein
VWSNVTDVASSIRTINSNSVRTSSQTLPIQIRNQAVEAINSV